MVAGDGIESPTPAFSEPGSRTAKSFVSSTSHEQTTIFPISLNRNGTESAALAVGVVVSTSVGSAFADEELFADGVGSMRPVWPR